MSSIKISAAIYTIALVLVLAIAAPIDTTEKEGVEWSESTPTEATQGTTTQTPEPEETPQMPDFTSYKNTSTFSCVGRMTGYYADVKLGCRIYHFCTAMDGLAETTYERMSYICLEGSVFDQKDLNCVREKELKTPCFEAESEYESSNRQFDHKD